MVERPIGQSEPNLTHSPEIREIERLIDSADELAEHDKRGARQAYATAALLANMQELAAKTVGIRRRARGLRLWANARLPAGMQI